MKKKIGVSSRFAPAELKGATSRGIDKKRKAEVLKILARTIVESSVAFCGKCHEPLLEMWKYCPECGQKIGWEDL
jgi:hypothetical protein